MPIETLRDIICHGTEAYGVEVAFRYKVKREIADRSYRDVNRDSMLASRMVESIGMGGKHIALIGTTVHQWIVGCFGVVDNSGIAVPIDAQLPADVVCGPLGRADVEILIFDETRRDVVGAVKEKCPRIHQIISMQTAEPGDGIQPLSMQMMIHIGEYETAIDPDQVYTILFASRIMGKSKGVMLSYRNPVGSAVCLGMKTPAGTVSMILLPISHVYCLIMDIVKGLYIGPIICINNSITHVQGNMKLFKPETMLLISLVIESIYGKLRDAGNLTPKKVVAKVAFGRGLKTICSGGVYLGPDYMERFKEHGITILQGYGMTECSPVVSINLEWDHKTDSVGKFLLNCEARIVDEKIWVRGTNVMQGYYKTQEETNQMLENGWLKIGNLGYMDEDNLLHITDRRKNLIVLSNEENVSPEELENQLNRSDLVEKVLVRGKGKVIEAGIFPDYEYIKKRHVKDMGGGLRELIDEFNKDISVHKKICSLVVREAELEKMPPKKIKRF